MSLRIGLVGEAGSYRTQNPNESLILRVMEKVSGSRIELVEAKHAEIILVHPYKFPFNSTVAGALFETSANKLSWFRDSDSAEFRLRRLFNLPKKVKLLLISHENLDRRPWQVFGNLLTKTNIPRLTFWPEELDPIGFRFPYWWNYIEWPEISRPGYGDKTRFGALYNLDALCSYQNLELDKSFRQEKAVWLTRHLDFPRRSIIAMIEKHMKVDVVRDVPNGEKLELLKSYRFCITSENSVGFGYETEKNLEARIAGCIPVGYIQNPFSDFNPDAFFFTPPVERVSLLPPLLRKEPSLNALFEYLAKEVLPS